MSTLHFQKRHAVLNGAELHFLDSGGSGSPMLMLHAITGNAHIFNGLAVHGLAQRHRLIIPDLRGRGASEKGTGKMTLADQCEDMIALLNLLELDRVTVCGHSFGGYLGIYLAAHYPGSIAKLILIDTVAEMNPMTPLLIQLTLGRMLMRFPDRLTYDTMVSAMPFMTIHDPLMKPFTDADTSVQPDGSLEPTAKWPDVGQAIADLFRYSGRDWRRMLLEINAPTLVLAATDPFAFGQQIVETPKLLETVTLLQYGTDQRIPGNHFTMIFGAGAPAIVTAIYTFMKYQSPARRAAKTETALTVINSPQ